VKPRYRHRAIGIGLLLPGLLLTHPDLGRTDGRSTKQPTRKIAPSSPQSEGRARAKAPALHKTPRTTVHVVRHGETVSRLAARYGVKRHAIIEANRLSRPQQLRLGQRLSIPSPRAMLGEGKAFRVEAIESDGDVLVVRTGKRRVATRLSMVAPELELQAQRLIWPIDGNVVSPFGRRLSGWHAGTDIQADLGTPILAAADGLVVASGEEGGYGRIIRIQHRGSIVTVYAHNLENFVGVGEWIAAGAIIGIVGRSGSASAPHLHFEVRHEGLAYNPLQFLPPREVIELRPDDAPDQPAESARARVVGDKDNE
jgi:murein DD-endopeptidase MepM/ murein hydrolase activator NlpD